jgi:tRNA (adenine22-N1)-methyltransferase
MRQPRLPRRLQTVLALVPRDAQRVADIGSGHGALALHLSNVATTVIATEDKAGPFAELCRNVEAWGAQESVETRLGANLQPLRAGEVDAVVIAGVSARTALGVCAQARAKGVRWVVLQCVQGAGEVEPWMLEHGWAVFAREDVNGGRRAYPTWLLGVPG